MIAIYGSWRSPPPHLLLSAQEVHVQLASLGQFFQSNQSLARSGPWREGSGKILDYFLQLRAGDLKLR